MEVGAVTSVETFGEKVTGLMQGITSIGSAKGEEVELEEDSHVVQTMVVGGVHIGVTLGMSQQRGITTVGDFIELVVKIHGRVEVGGLD